ncbi:hypothetical protein J6590_065107 [Homalodisca vitripennis]|nr:hypothetical protein J6590_065107 [Homalodisca vitripennis]
MTPQHDLVAAEAKYHNDCVVSFLKPTTGGQVGRPQDEALNLAIGEIFSYIKSTDDYQPRVKTFRQLSFQDDVARLVQYPASEAMWWGAVMGLGGG